MFSATGLAADLMTRWSNTCSSGQGNDRKACSKVVTASAVTMCKATVVICTGQRGHVQEPAVLQWRGCRQQTSLLGTERLQDVSFGNDAWQLSRRSLLGSQCSVLLLAAKQPALLQCAQLLSHHLQ